MQLSDELRPVALELTAWAHRTACVRRVWIFGSRARGDHTRTSDVDVALDIDPVGNDESAEVSFIATAWKWRDELDARIPYKLHLQWYDPSGSTPPVQRGVETSGILVYERAVQPDNGEAML